MTFTVEQKSQLAKLMATENLRVEHQKIRTAKFDPTNRILYLPIWQNMTGVLYDLLCGHEVGHALYTPAEGWHDAVVDKSKPKAYKHFLNVVEDARIEKKVKRKYPGLKSSFLKAYNELLDRDFFGIKDRDINTMSFIDRLNLFTKSQYTATWIKFSDEEQLIIRKIEAMETWDDVLRVTNEVYEYSKNEQFEMQSNDFQPFDMDMDGNYDDEYSDDYSDFEDDSDEDGTEDRKSNSSGEGDQDEDSEESSDSDNDGEGNENDLNEGEEFGQKVNRFKDSRPSDKDTFVPKCETDEAFRNNEDLLLDEKCKPYVYADIPKPNYKNIITQANRVHQQLVDYYLKPYINVHTGTSHLRVTTDQAKKWVNEFKNKNERYVGLLAKEFEMRKAAKAFSKSKLSDTGDIDINKLSSYKFDDNIFRKVMLTPKGKNHGLILLLDKSGSMSNNMAGSIEQILILSMFCRKVNIPFIVYGFGDSLEAHASDLGLNMYEYHKQTRTGNLESFSRNENELALGTVFLREYLNNKMSNSEFSQSLRNMIILKKSYEGRRGYGNISRPVSEDLSNTPLTASIYAVAGIMKQFRARYNLDLTSLIIVHDGDSDYCNAVLKTVEQKNWQTEKIEQVKSRKAFSFTSQNVFLRDTSNKFEMKLVEKQQDEMLTSSLEWFKKTTNSKVFGFFLTDSSSRMLKGSLYNRYVMENGKSLHQVYNEMRKTGDVYKFDEIRNTYLKKIKSEKFLSSNTPGYTSFYLVLGGDELKTDNEELAIEGKYTSSKLKSAFMKMNKRKAINRVLVSKFIQGIAA